MGYAKRYVFIETTYGESPIECTGFADCIRELTENNNRIILTDETYEGVAKAMCAQPLEVKQVQLYAFGRSGDNAGTEPWIVVCTEQSTTTKRS